jgi:hypothetical protein
MYEQFTVNGIFFKSAKGFVILTLSFLSKKGKNQKIPLSKKNYRHDIFSTVSLHLKHDKSLVGIIVALLQEKTIGFLFAACVRSISPDDGKFKFK